MQTPDTPQQAKAREEYNAACRQLARCSYALRQAQNEYRDAMVRYNEALGAARHLGVV